MARELEALVTAALKGDGEAFGGLVLRFQDMAYAVSYAMLGDPHLAQDAAQEAFIDAYLNLAQLREPAAFAGWLRRIVIKHSDRQVRGKRPARVPLEAIDEIPSPLPGPECTLEDLEFKQDIASAIAALPQRQRLVTALFYLRDFSYREIATCLEMSLPSVKKDLYVARQRLKERMVHMIQENIQANKPSQDDHFSDQVRFFVALKAGDLATVRRLAVKDHALLSARSAWGIAAEGYYWPTGFTALHWAAATGDEPLARFLIDQGAEVDALTPSEMTPLHVAALMRRAALAALLLQHGASLAAQTGLGFTPLHCAVLRENLAMTEFLLAQGADPRAVDQQGRTALDWARMKANLQLVELLSQGTSERPAEAKVAASEPPARRVPAGPDLLGRVIDAAGNPLDGGPALPADHFQPLRSPVPQDELPLLETGIKIVDLLAPLRRGGLNGVLTPLIGVGKFVLLDQLIAHFARRYAGYVVCAGVEDGAYNGSNLMLAWRDWGVDAVTVNVFAPGGDDGQPDAPAAAATAVAIAEDWRGQGREALLLADSRLALLPGAWQALSQIRNTGRRPAITVIFHGEQSLGALPAPLDRLDAALTFEAGRARQHLWPAVDPLRSYSRWLAAGEADPEHARVAHATRQALQRSADLQPLLEGATLDRLPDLADRQAVARARRLERFLTQPFSGAEPWTGIPGAYVPLGETLRGAREILSGAYDNLPEEAFYFIGSMV